jgi:hypothetical protein
VCVPDGGPLRAETCSSIRSDVPTEWPKKMYTLFTHQYIWNKSVPGSNSSRLLPMAVPKGWCLWKETSYTGWSTIKHRNVLCSYDTGHITERSSCSSSATSTVSGCRWWPLRTPTLNSKFKDISHITFVLRKYSSYDYTVMFFLSNMYTFFGPLCIG